MLKNKKYIINLYLKITALKFLETAAFVKLMYRIIVQLRVMLPRAFRMQLYFLNVKNVLKL